NPDSPWGIFGYRQIPKTRVRSLMLRVALVAPILALLAEACKEMRHHDAAWRQQQAAWRQPQVDWVTGEEQGNPLRAMELDRQAGEFRAKEASGEPRMGDGSWTEVAKTREDMAKSWRKRASWARGMRKSWEEM